MKYYKEIDIDDFEIIVAKTLIYIKKYTSLTKVPVRYNWHQLTFDDFVLHIPELKTAFLKFGLTPNFVALYIVYNNKTTAIHKDAYSNLARINLPILNSEGTYTNFYKNVVFQKYVHPVTGIPSYNVINDDYELVDRVEIKKATLFRVLEAHKVDVPDGNPLPRITLTIGFDKDPVFLLED